LQPTNTRRVNSFVGRPRTNHCGPNGNYLNSTNPPKSNSTLSTTSVPLHRDPAKEKMVSLLFPARLSRETPFQAIEISWISAGLRCLPPCILRKSPCISQKCRERPVRWGLHPPPRIHVFCRHVETRRKCPPTAGLFQMRRFAV